MPTYDITFFHFCTFATIYKQHFTEKFIVQVVTRIMRFAVAVEYLLD